MGGGGAFSVAWRTFLGYWFVHAYIALMMLSPILNKTEECIADKGAKVLLECLLPFYILCFGWSWASSYNTTAGFVPRVDGLGQFTPLTLIGIYMTGRIVRRVESRIKINNRMLFSVMILLLLLSACRLGVYNSPIALALAIGSFLLCKKVHLPPLAMRVVLFIAPSMFSVYLLHTNTLGMSVIIPYVVGHTELYLNKWIAYLLCALAIFFMGVVVDLFRQFIMYCARGVFSGVMRLFASMGSGPMETP